MVAAAEKVRLEAFDGFAPAAFGAGAPADAVERSFDDMVAHNRRSAKTHSGIWRVLAGRKRPTEVNAQLGSLVKNCASTTVHTIEQRTHVPEILTYRCE